MIAPPGWECQPEEPPGCTVICVMTMSVPACSGMVPFDELVPRAKGTWVSPDGGVAPPGATVTTANTPAIPALSNAHLTTRFMSPPPRRSRVRGRPARQETVRHRQAAL